MSAESETISLKALMKALMARSALTCLSHHHHHVQGVLKNVGVCKSLFNLKLVCKASKNIFRDTLYSSAFQVGLCGDLAMTVART